jgi:hypothetical protein
MSEAAQAIHGKPEASRALVPLGGSPEPVKPAVRPLAAFVAQVMACEARLPEFRQHRRAQPSEASARYESAQHGWRPRPDTRAR